MGATKEQLEYIHNQEIEKREQDYNEGYVNRNFKTTQLKTKKQCQKN